MEQEINNLGEYEDFVELNRLTNEIHRIFDIELALPPYYNEKNLLGGVKWKRCGILMRMI